MSAAAGHPPRKATAGLLVVLVAAMGVGPILNYGLSAVSPLILASLGMSQSQFGLLAGAVFASAAVSSFSLGRLSDRAGTRTQLVLIFGGTVVALVIAALAHSFWVLLAAVIIAGPAQSISNPTTNRVIVTSVPPHKRAGWIGIKQSGVQASQLFSGLFFPAVALWLGWQGAFGLAALIALGLLAYGFAQVPSEPARPRSAARRGSGGPLPFSMWLFAGFAFFSGLGMQATNVYLPLYAVRELGFPLVLAGAAAGVSGIVGVSSRIVWGRRMAGGARPSGLLLALALGAIVGVACLLGAGALHQPWLVWAGVALHGATVLGANVIMNAAVLVVVPSERVGVASGVLAAGMYTGFSLGPLVMGVLADATGSYDAGWLAVGAGYLVCAGLALWLRRYGATHPWTSFSH
ncbi:MFS transporter [Sinomonas atrocyanea]|uniref:MFS transporter n=1 Tax=Sinomonas atrocyanea TaxID=37927 RepID=UPI0028553E80|nr:MFS transporter [Sinomonas atrocyanea]MDR6621984.1 MFS family permease [Sinomonas atrocyanea]